MEFHNFNDIFYKCYEKYKNSEKIKYKNNV